MSWCHDEEISDMNVFVRLDLEGVTGVVSYAQVEPGATDYAYGQRMATGDINAAVEGCFEGGASRVVVYDMHCHARNIPLDEFDPRGELICGKPSLPRQFLEEFGARSSKAVTGLSEAVAERLVSYPWPGNVRELRNAIERAVTLTRYNRLGIEDLPERIRCYQPSHVIVGYEDPAELLPMEEIEKRYIGHVLKSTGGNKSLAARVLGFDRKTLYRKLERYGDLDQG